MLLLLEKGNHTMPTANGSQEILWGIECDDIDLNNTNNGTVCANKDEMVTFYQQIQLSVYHQNPKETGKALRANSWNIQMNIE